MILKNPALFQDDIGNIRTELLDSKTAVIIDEIKKIGKNDFKLDDLGAKLGEDQKYRLEFANLKAQELMKDFSDKDLRSEFLNINNTLERNSVYARLAELEMDIKSAETTNEKAKLAGLLIRFNDLTKELNGLK